MPLVHGTENRGHNIHDTDRKLSACLKKEAAVRLNLAPHHVRGNMDLNMKLLHAACDVMGYKGVDGRYYLLNFRRAMPPEADTETPHLPPTPRGASMEVPLEIWSHASFPPPRCCTAVGSTCATWACSAACSGASARAA
jgi:hypothetical protein